MPASSFSLPNTPLFSTRSRTSTLAQPRTTTPALSRGSSSRMRTSFSSTTTTTPSRTSSRTSNSSVAPHFVFPSPRHRVTVDETSSSLCPSSPSSTYSSSSSKYSHQKQQTQDNMLPMTGPREAALADGLSRATSPTEAVAVLEEYAWRSLKAGMRVRDYCHAADNIVQMCPRRGVRMSMSMLQTPVGLLYPFSLIPGALVASVSSSALPSSTLAHLSKKHLSETLVRLVREQDEAVVRAQVLELALEYVGRRWREGDGSFIEAIAKKFGEVQTELRAVPGAAQVVIPALDSFRIQFGFVDTPQLIALLEKGSTFCKIDATQLVTAWTIRRLSAGTEPKFIIADLYFVRDHMKLESLRQVINNVFKSFALDGRETSPQWIMDSRPRTRTLSRLSFPRGGKRKTLAIPWLAKLQYDDRRPSLPTHLSPTESSPTSWSRMGAFGASTSDFSPPMISPPATATMCRNRSLGMSFTNLSSHSLATNSLGLSDSTIDVRSALADHLLFLRYRLGSDADGWCLGCGKDKAIDFLDQLEAKEDTKDIVLQLRKVFDIQPRGSSQPRTFHERDVSFDLDQYIADIGPQGDEDDSHPPSSYRRKEAIRGRASIASISTAATGKSSISMSFSTLGEFTICEATREPMTVKEVGYRFPERSPDRSDASKTATPQSEETVLAATPAPRLAKSMASLVRSKSSKSLSLSQSRRMGRRPSAAALLPAFDASILKCPATEFPSLMPPLVSTETVDEPLPYESPSPLPKALGPVAGDWSPNKPRSRRTTMDGAVGGDSHHRRQQFRQCVIVNGEQLSPGGGTIPLEVGIEPDIAATTPTAPTALKAVLSLFIDSTITPMQVKEKLNNMIKTELRNAGEGEAFESEIKPRLVWLLRQVIAELKPSDLAAAAESVLDELLAPAPCTPSRQFAPRPPSPGGMIHSSGRRDLTIVVPPRHLKSLVLASPDGHNGVPSLANTFGARRSIDSPRTPRISPSSSDTSTVSSQRTASSDGDRTPLRPTHQVTDTSIPRRAASNSAPSSRHPSYSSPWQTPKSTPLVPYSPTRWPASPNSSRKNSTSSLNRPSISRKPVPPLPALPPLPPLPPIPVAHRTPIDI